MYPFQKVEQYNEYVKLFGLASNLIAVSKHMKKRLIEMGADKAKISIIPCATDYDHFSLKDSSLSLAAKKMLGINPTTKVVTYLGSIGTWYLLDEMLEWFSEFKLKWKLFRIE